LLEWLIWQKEEYELESAQKAPAVGPFTVNNNNAQSNNNAQNDNGRARVELVQAVKNKHTHTHTYTHTHNTIQHIHNTTQHIYTQHTLKKQNITNLDFFYTRIFRVATKTWSPPQ